MFDESPSIKTTYGINVIRMSEWKWSLHYFNVGYLTYWNVRYYTSNMHRYYVGPQPLRNIENASFMRSFYVGY